MVTCIKSLRLVYFTFTERKMYEPRKITEHIGLRFIKSVYLFGTFPIFRF